MFHYLPAASSDSLKYEHVSIWLVAIVTERQFEHLMIFFWLWWPSKREFIAHLTIASNQFCRMNLSRVQCPVTSKTRRRQNSGSSKCCASWQTSPCQPRRRREPYYDPSVSSRPTRSLSESYLGLSGKPDLWEDYLYLEYKFN